MLKHFSKTCKANENGSELPQEMHKENIDFLQIFTCIKQQWLKKQLKVTIEEPSSWSKARAQESKREKKKGQREMRAKGPK